MYSEELLAERLEREDSVDSGDVSGSSDPGSDRDSRLRQLPRMSI